MMKPKISTVCSSKDRTCSKRPASSAELHTKDCCIASLSNQLKTQELYKAGFQRGSKLTKKAAVESVEVSKQNPNSGLELNSWPYCNRRNAICEAIEKQCVDYELEKAVSLHQKRDNLRLEYVLKELCLL